MREERWRREGGSVREERWRREGGRERERGEGDSERTGEVEEGGRVGESVQRREKY